MNLKPLRKAANLTQQQLADKSGIRRVTIARIETGGIPSLNSLMALSAALGCTIDTLLGENTTTQTTA